MPLIELKNVIGGYGGAPILNGVNMSIEQSDIGVIVGPNGAGKSTTLKAIFGLLKVTEGSIVFGGEEIEARLFRNRDTGDRAIRIDGLDVVHDLCCLALGLQDRWKD